MEDLIVVLKHTRTTKGTEFYESDVPNPSVRNIYLDKSAVKTYFGDKAPSEIELTIKAKS